MLSIEQCGMRCRMDGMGYYWSHPLLKQVRYMATAEISFRYLNTQLAGRDLVLPILGGNGIKSAFGCVYAITYISVMRSDYSLLGQSCAALCHYITSYAGNSISSLLRGWLSISVITSLGIGMFCQFFIHQLKLVNASSQYWVAYCALLLEQLLSPSLQ